MTKEVWGPLYEWVIYDHPRDFPDHFVARLYAGVSPTDRILVGPSLNALRAQLRDIDPNLVCFTRAENDDPTIVEVWL